MDTTAVNPLEICQKCIDTRESFVLQGGAGSGKTESLKDLLLYLSKTNPSARVVCITHTNNAVLEIKERIGEKYPVSTIHSFLHDLIRDYKRNIKHVLPTLYTLSRMKPHELAEGENEKEYKKAEHEQYKKVYGKFADKLYSIKGETCEKYAGKKEYDAAPNSFNDAINSKIDNLNASIVNIVTECDHAKIHYNETKFDSLRELTYGHDGLLLIAHLLFEQYPVLGKIIIDKYDYIFIDEYQDTNLNVIQDLLALTKQNYGGKQLALCLFGDAMQAIYSDGIGSVEAHIDAGDLTLIPKADNYRCSYEIIDLINPLRLDGITQKVALAKDANGQLQTEAERHGDVKVLYAVCAQRPTGFSDFEAKQNHSEMVDLLVSKATEGCTNPKVLMLTNKSIAEKVGFKHLYKVFDDRYVEVSDRMDNYLKRMQISEICEICNLYSSQQYNSLIKIIRSGGYVIHSQQDKIRLKEIIGKLLTDENISLYAALQYAVDSKLVKMSEACQNLLNANAQYLRELSADKKYQEFKKLYLDGLNTFARIKDYFTIASEEEFDYYKSRYKKEMFIEILFSDAIKFSEALNYTHYLNEESNYVTMHKTKGSSIDSVIVVMEEFYWNEYDFSLLYNGVEKQEKRENSQKLIYVACSRARKSLRCVRLLPENEVAQFKACFPTAEEVTLGTHT